MVVADAKTEKKEDRIVKVLPKTSVAGSSSVAMLLLSLSGVILTKKRNK